MTVEQWVTVLALVLTLIFSGVSLYQHFHWREDWTDSFFTGFTVCLFILLWLAIIGLIIVTTKEIFSWPSIQSLLQ